MFDKSAFESHQTELFAGINMNEFSLSIIIPTYNGGSKLIETLKRLRQCDNQKAAEIIVVDDGSKDDSLSLLELHKEPLSLKVLSKTNGGPGSARNAGAKIAQGEYLMFLGDDTAPANTDFINTHLQMHAKIRNKSKAVLGKIVWPSCPHGSLNLTEFLIQGEGQQQFGFCYMEPWKEYSWPFFYTSNISLHHSLVSDWELNGFSDKFYLAAYEDGEFAYRLSIRHPDFGIIYCPTALIEHNHPYTFTKFISRQLNCGQMADILIQIHPELRDKVLPANLLEAIEKDLSTSTPPLDQMISIIEGIKGFCEYYDSKHLLGSQNWHKDFVNASLDLFYSYGYILSAKKIHNRSAALEMLITNWSKIINQCAQKEVFGSASTLLP